MRPRITNYLIASRWTFSLVGALTLVAISLSKLWPDPPVWFIFGAVDVAAIFVAGLAGHVAFWLSRRESAVARKTLEPTDDQR